MKSIIDIYNKMLIDGNNDSERVGWGSVDSQKNRFRILMEIGNLENKSILDIGCGLGTMLDYIHKRKSILSYTGVDINSNMVKEAKQKHPNAEFKSIDIIKDAHELGDKKFDYVFLSGALNLNADNHRNSIKIMMNEMFALANKGVALNFLSVFADRLSPGEYYCNPIDILELALTITKKVTLRHDYMPHDFTVYLYR
jgi:ubiquinone/menaquinone biosynthesis C-methylase UbiE